jgi:hypothetical protein
MNVYHQNQIVLLHELNIKHTNSDVSSVCGSISTDLIDSGNAESLARTWSLLLVLDGCTGNPLRTNISIVPNLTTLIACGACNLSCGSRRGASGGSLTSVWSLWGPLRCILSWTLTSSSTSPCTLRQNIARTPG